jgi:phytol kinase
MRELFRQGIHLVFGIGIAALVLVLDRNTAIATLAAGLLFGAVLVDLVLRGCTLPGISWLLSCVDRSDPLPGRGALFFVVSALSCVILFPAHVVVPALVALAVLDSVATLAGTRFGRRRFANGKSLEGSMAGIAVTIPVLLPLLSLPGAVLVSFLAGIIELVSPVDDNLLIPIIVCAALSLVPALV